MSKKKNLINVHKDLQNILSRFEKIREKLNLIIDIKDKDGIPELFINTAGKPAEFLFIKKDKDFIIHYTNDVDIKKVLKEFENAGII